MLVVILAFVPAVGSLESAFECLSVHIASIFPELIQIFIFLETYYLDHVNPERGRVPAKIDIKFWNHYDMVILDCEYLRTSNMIESFHNGFKSRVNRARPTVQGCV